MEFIPVLIFIFGTIIGSFLNVVIYRINTGRSIARGRSKCAICSETLHWQDLVPVWSFLALGGKCRTCKTRISFQYPLVELITGILFTILYMQVLLPFGFSVAGFVQFFFVAAVCSVAIIIAAYDFRHKIIPVAPMRVLFLLAFGSVVVRFLLDSTFPLGEGLLAGPVVALPFFLLWLVSRGRWMGFGDVKLALALGWLFGLSAGLSIVLVSFWIGGIIGLFLLAISNRYGMKSQIPFAPFLLAAGLVVYFSGATINSLLPLW